MQHTYTIETDSDTEIVVYTNAMKNHFAVVDFENTLRRLHKNTPPGMDEDTIERIWLLWLECEVSTGG